jgi:hypothetical protein
MISSKSQHSGSVLKTFFPDCTCVNKTLLPLFQQAANGPTGRGGPVTISNLCGDGGQDTVDTWNTYNQPHEIPTSTNGRQSKASPSISYVQRVVGRFYGFAEQQNNLYLIIECCWTGHFLAMIMYRLFISRIKIQSFQPLA